MRPGLHSKRPELRIRPMRGGRTGGSGEERSLAWLPVLLAGGVGAANAILAARIAPQRLELAALELAFIAGAYPGMAIGTASRRVIAIELAAAGAFLAAAIAGTASGSRTTIAAGLLAHGGWDLAHHRGIGVAAPERYPEFCFLADLLLVIPLVRR